eukprot:g1317.t1
MLRNLVNRRSLRVWRSVSVNRNVMHSRWFSSDVESFVESSLKEAGFSNDMISEEIKKLSDAKVLNTDVLGKLTHDDWVSTGVSTGASVVLRDALDELSKKSAEEKIKKTSKLQRTLSREQEKKRMKL